MKQFAYYALGNKMLAVDTDSLKKLKRKIFLSFLLSFAILIAMLMLPAGSWKYWQGWTFCLLILTYSLLITIYFFHKSPEFLTRRMKFKETDPRQKTIMLIGSVFFFLGFLIPGFDYRFGWSAVPWWLVVSSNLIILAGYSLIFLSFKENPYAARTVEVFEGQKVIDTGPYAIIRHPMYAGSILMSLFMPLALGSFWAIIPFILVCVIIIWRMLNEEKFLKCALPGYIAYCQKVRYRIVPWVW